jgi:hypothetical protein
LALGFTPAGDKFQTWRQPEPPRDQNLGIAPKDNLISLVGWKSAIVENVLKGDVEEKISRVAVLHPCARHVAV